MPSFFRKAISLFVILDEESPQQQAESTVQEEAAAPAVQQKVKVAEPAPMSKEDLSKFEKHFEKLFEDTNLPGPDYFEFWKTMDTLESHISDEKARMKAVYASLSIQGLTKQNLIETAGVYKTAILQDKSNFESAVQKKSDAEIAGRAARIEKLQLEHEEKRQLIDKLQQEIAAAAQEVETLQAEIGDEQGKIESAQRGYLAACTAMVSKIDEDVQQFQQIIE